MKKLLLLSLIAAGATACHTYNRTPNMGGVGEYGFTYDLDATPSPFKDRSYRPVSPYDVTAPIIITVTNEVPLAVRPPIGPETGVTTSGSVSAEPSTVIGTTEIKDAAGAALGIVGSKDTEARNAAESASATVNASPGVSVNEVPENTIIVANTNTPNANRPSAPTGLRISGTDSVIADPAGAQSRTNTPSLQEPPAGRSITNGASVTNFIAPPANQPQLNQQSTIPNQNTIPATVEPATDASQIPANQPQPADPGTQPTP